MKVFVYGTLMQGMPNHVVLERGSRNDGGFTFLGKGQTVGRDYRMADLGPFPACVPCASACTIKGELFEVGTNAMAALDRLEGYPTFYNRVEVKVRVEGVEHLAWVYVMRKAPRSPAWVPRNDWRKHVGAMA